MKSVPAQRSSQQAKQSNVGMIAPRAQVGPSTETAVGKDQRRQEKDQGRTGRKTGSPTGRQGQKSKVKPRASERTTFNPVGGEGALEARVPGQAM